MRLSATTDLKIQIKQITLNVVGYLEAELNEIAFIILKGI